MNLSTNALAVVVNHSTCEDLKVLREQNTKIMKSIKSLVDDLSTRLKYYFNLVALARTGQNWLELARTGQNWLELKEIMKVVLMG